MDYMPHRHWQDKAFFVRLPPRVCATGAYLFYLGSITATVFPLFANQMFTGLGYRWANTLFASIALLMSPVPIVRHKEYMHRQHIDKILRPGFVFLRTEDASAESSFSEPHPVFTLIRFSII
jgi:hypothetical protein